MAERRFKQRRIASILSEDGTIKFDFMTSLQNIVICKIVSELWMGEDIRKEIKNLFHSDIRLDQSEFSDKWQQIEDNIAAKISKLTLPKSIAKMLKYIVSNLGNSINEWVRYHDKCLLGTRKYSKYSAVDLIHNIAWTARGKIDYAQTAKNILSNQDSYLTDDHKYKLACTYCLEDEVTILAPTILDQCYLDNILMNVHPMVYFWTSRVTGDNAILNNPSNYSYDMRRHIDSMSINERIIYLLINSSNRVSFNEVPIKYIWNRLAEEEKAKYVTALVTELHKQDLRYTLLSNLDCDQQRGVFRECSCSILCGILNDWLWRDYFLSVALHVVDIMNPLSYLYILKEINKEKSKNAIEENAYLYNEYNNIFKELWRKGPKNFKDFIFEHQNGCSLVELVMHKLSWKRDFDIIEVIFNDLNLQQKRKLIFGINGIGRCAYLIKSDQWDLLELFINNTLSSEVDINLLKERLIKVKGQSIVIYFLKQAEFQKIEKFTSWAFRSNEKIDNFRRSLAHTKIYEAALEAIIVNRKVDFNDLENHFRWCAKDDIEIINQLKCEVPKLYSGKELISKLIQDDQYELLDEVLNWCFCGNQQQISDFKRSMYHDNGNLSPSVKRIIHILIEKDNSLKMLDKFIAWSFTNMQEAQNLKLWVLYEHYVCIKLLEKHKFELVDKFINWCDISSEAKKEFKNSFMISNDMKYILYHARWDAKSDLQLLIKWFNPSKETVQKFKTVFSENDCPKRFYNFLDEFLESQNNNLISKYKENVSLNLRKNLETRDCIQPTIAIATLPATADNDAVTPNITNNQEYISQGLQISSERQDCHNGNIKNDRSVINKILSEDIIGKEEGNISQNLQETLESQYCRNDGTREMIIPASDDAVVQNIRIDDVNITSQNSKENTECQDYHNHGIQDKPNFEIVVTQNVIGDVDGNFSQDIQVNLESTECHIDGNQAESIISTADDFVDQNTIEDDKRNISINLQIISENQDYLKSDVNDEPTVIIVEDAKVQNTITGDGNNILQASQIILQDQNYNNGTNRDETNANNFINVSGGNITSDEERNMSHDLQVSIESQDFYNQDESLIATIDEVVAQNTPNSVTVVENTSKNIKTDNEGNASQAIQIPLEIRNYDNDSNSEDTLIVAADEVTQNIKANENEYISERVKVSSGGHDCHSAVIQGELTVVAAGQEVNHTISLYGEGNSLQGSQIHVEEQKYQNNFTEDKLSVSNIGKVVTQNVIADDDKNILEVTQIYLESQNLCKDGVKDEETSTTNDEAVIRIMDSDDELNITRTIEVDLEDQVYHQCGIQDELNIVTIGEVVPQIITTDGSENLQVRLGGLNCHDGYIKNEPIIVAIDEIAVDNIIAGKGENVSKDLKLSSGD